MMRGLFYTVLFCLFGTVYAQGNLSLNPPFLFDDVGESELPKGAEFKGDFVAAKTWTDKGGDNFFIVSEIKSPKEFKNELYVYQYAETAGILTLVWDIKDFPSALCMATTIENSLQIIDLDGDGYMETSFIYQFQCDGLDPTVTKLMLHSRGQKLAIRGSIPIESDMGGPVKKMDPSASQFPKVMRNFASQEWDDFVAASGLIEYAKSIPSRTSDLILLEKEYLLASGGTEYELLDDNGVPVPLAKETRELIRYASDLRFMPDGQHLFIASLPRIGLLDLRTFEFTTWVTLFEDTEALSTVDWSPSDTRLAFVTLNMDKYPSHTRVFVLDVDGTQLVRKQKFDVPVDFIVAASYSVSSVTFISGESTLLYHEKHPEPGEASERVKKIYLD